MEKISFRLLHVLTSRGMLDQKRAQHGQTHRMKSTFGRCGCQRWKLSPLPKTSGKRMHGMSPQKSQTNLLEVDSNQAVLYDIICKVKEEDGKGHIW